MENWEECLITLKELKDKGTITVEGTDMIYLINSLCIPQELSYDKCIQNLYLIMGTSFWEYRPPEIGTISITRILTEQYMMGLQSYFSIPFVAFFPDIYIWIRDSADTNTKVFNWFRNILIDDNYYNTKEKKLFHKTYSLLCDYYIEQGNSFETKQ